VWAHDPEEYVYDNYGTSSVIGCRTLNQLLLNLYREVSQRHEGWRAARPGPQYRTKLSAGIQMATMEYRRDHARPGAGHSGGAGLRKLGLMAGDVVFSDLSVE
jgi:hypothetical protein